MTYLFQTLTWADFVFIQIEHTSQKLLVSVWIVLPQARRYMLHIRSYQGLNIFIIRSHVNAGHC